MDQWPKRKADAVGRYVRTARPIGTRAERYAVGTAFKILKDHGGLQLSSPSCEHCGASLIVFGVDHRLVELLPADYQPGSEPTVAGLKYEVHKLREALIETKRRTIFWHADSTEEHRRQHTIDRLVEGGWLPKGYE